mgnify:CR=1 FL=1
MKPQAHRLILLLAAVLSLPVQASDHGAEIEAALAIGLGPTTASIKIAPTASFEQAAAAVRTHLSVNPTERKEVARQAAIFVDGDATNIPPLPGANTILFTEVAFVHLQKLASNKSAYRQVLRRAYHYVVGRDAYEEEIAYWSQHPTLPYALLVGCIEDWARRNQPGLMNTAGTPTVSVNCELLATTRVPPQLGARIATFLGLPAKTTVLAPGGSGLKSSGDIRFVVSATR